MQTMDHVPGFAAECNDLLPGPKYLAVRRGDEPLIKLVCGARSY
jgi:hypothetical protein